MKMLMMLMVAAILFCSHQQVVVAREVAGKGNELQIIPPWDIPCYLPWPFPWPRPWPCPPPRPRPQPRPRPCPPPPPPPCPPPPLPPRSPPPPPPRSPPPPPPRSPPPTPFSGCSISDQEKVKKCMFNTTSIDACCPTFKSILGTSCPCYKYAEDLDNQVLITLEAYCDVDSPCSGMLSPPPPVTPTPFSDSCSASDKEKVKTCMFNTTSIDECCPTFKSILGTSCPCYKYAEELDNQVLITLESYCDVDSPCTDLQQAESFDDTRFLYTIISNPKA
ncbi:pollen-specific leucine-rich repeat extensin-like protein 1 isoform X2 [Capsicum annuum]|uniref:pollen-specific leucine-rich repeat extensin-like protein 1 isoform X2 n=1 Tax=Capsicum annuum TaxID=4072 RepID=UPI001FB19195|nr:pollen-specific leucine-rich repeat extensin-like protein 1 isoform X2 [Capsicum annuum]